MKRQIRKNCFETNSSSTHAICITKEDVENIIIPEHIYFEHGEFGWNYSTYSTLLEKASYLYQAICDCNNLEEKERKLNIISKLLDECGISCEFEPDKDEWGDGYIDHAAETVEFIDAVLNDKDKLLKFLFGNSFIITGNDNGDDFLDRMYVNEGEVTTKYGSYTKYGDLKPEFNEYEIYMKGN